MEMLFRKIKQDTDLEMILNWRTLPEVTAYMYTDFKPSMDQQREWCNRIAEDATRKDWIIAVDGEEVGLVTLCKIDLINKRCEWAYYLGSPNVRGKGIGRNVEMNILEYVFDQMGLNKLCCEVFCSNELVIKIHQKYGSRIEGKRLKHIFKHGQYHDIVQMGILREEWEENIKGKIEYIKGQFE